MEITDEPSQSAQAQELLASLGRIAAQLRGPLSQLASIALFPLLESQRVLLTSYQRALEDPALHQAGEDYARALARALMSAYLETIASHRERSDAFVKAHSALITSYLQALDAVMTQLGGGHTT
jgi:hypothetical protein